MAVNGAGQEQEIHPGALADQICEVLKRQILSGQLEPGRRLSLEEFAARFGVSVTPIRDALRLLAAEGLVELIPRRGAFVTRPCWDGLQEIYQMRQIIECAAVDAVIANGQEVLPVLQSLLEQMAATNIGESHADYLTYIQLDQRFHQLMVDCLHNRRLSETYAGLGSHTLVARGLYSATHQRASETLAEHRRILAALQAGDRQGARAAIGDHLHNGLSELLQRVAADPASPPRGVQNDRKPSERMQSVAC